LTSEASPTVEPSCSSAQEKEKEKEKDPDPFGEQLAQTEDPLGEALKLVQRLREHSGNRLKTHELAFEVYTPPLVPLSVVFA